MSGAPPSPAVPQCSSDEASRTACLGLDFFASHEELPFCVLHFPGPKAKPFWTAIELKLSTEDYDFGGVWFPEKVNFFGVSFPSPVNFAGATFAKEANFSEAQFTAVDFRGATFTCEANFSKAVFQEPADFSSAVFGANAIFYSATFADDALFTFATFSGETNFQKSSFQGVTSLDFMTCHDSITFGAKRDYKKTQGFGQEASLSIEGARIDKPEYVSFYTLALRPHWFVGTDVREFNFVEVEWLGLSKRGFRHHAEQEILSMQANGIDLPHRLLSNAYRQLAINAQETDRYKQGSLFRYWSMDIRRREHGKRWGFLTLDWWYWVASGYGERATRACVVFLMLWLTFAAAYGFVGFSRTTPKSSEQDRMEWSQDRTGQPMSIPSALIYSAEVITLQKPDPKPLTLWARAFVLLEGILGPIQFALLALAIRRKFMR